ncbi:MAG TPA: GDSL-type esterase/lipase family protein [Dyella sp.]|uniref:GDSL-type esterase/lipase family protein n=1 Tax=Dyella sp. TaxID=1869338 RepID=UPI002D78A816|nr:GDSL-type esterase/lipase family protein [Dyella sp.]HET6553910.1 GDSL-type esterase/lipase family protein [Dyella sp.]
MTSVIWRVLAALLLLGSLSSAALADSAPPLHWTPDIEAFVAADHAHPPAPGGVLFIGSSSINYWKSLAQDFPGIPVINRGFGGSAIPDSTYYADRIVWPYKPRLIVMYAGDNDINDGASADQVLAAFQAFVARARQGVPGVPVVYVSIKPSMARLALWPTMKQANDKIRAWAATQKDVRFVDIAPLMVDASGRPRPELFRPDGLHMVPAGYALWIAALKPVLAQYGFVTTPAQ